MFPQCRNVSTPSFVLRTGVVFSSIFTLSYVSTTGTKTDNSSYENKLKMGLGGGGGSFWMQPELKVELCSGRTINICRWYLHYFCFIHFSVHAPLKFLFSVEFESQEFGLLFASTTLNLAIIAEYHCDFHSWHQNTVINSANLRGNA